MTIYDISKILYKTDMETPSIIEKIVEKAEIVYRTMKNSLNRGLFTKLKDIHEAHHHHLLKD